MEGIFCRVSVWRMLVVASSMFAGLFVAEKDALANVKYEAVAISLQGNVYGLTTTVASNDVKTLFKTKTTEPQTIDVDITPNGEKIFLPRLDYNVVGSVSVLSGNSLMGTTYPGFPSAGSVRVTPDGTKAWVGNANAKDIWVMDTATEQVIQHFVFPNISSYTGAVREIAFSPDGLTAYLSLYYPGAVVVIDTTTYQMKQSIILSSYGPIPFEASPNGQYLYALGGGVVNVIDAVTYQVLVTYPEGGNNMAVSADGSTLYICNGSGIVVLDTALLASNSPNARKAFIPLQYVSDVAVTSDNKYLYTASEMDTIKVIDTATYAVVESIPVRDSRRIVVKP